MTIAEQMTRRDVAIAMHLDEHAAANARDLDFLRAQFDELIAEEKANCEAECGAIRAAAEVQVEERIASARRRQTQLHSTFLSVETSFVDRNNRAAALAAPIRAGASIMPPASAPMTTDDEKEAAQEAAADARGIFRGLMPPDSAAPAGPEDLPEAPAADPALQAVEQALDEATERAPL